MNILNLEQLKTVGQVAPNTIINADCLEAMKYIADKSIDCIICDLPYGITACKWDTVIPFEPLWEQYKRIIKPRGAIVLFGSQPFTSALVMSNPRWFKYEWIWDKHIPRNFVNAKVMPMRKHENILIFYQSSTFYYPQKTERKRPVKCKNYSKNGGAYKLNKKNGNQKEYIYTHRNPDTIITGFWQANKGKIHSTQKPVTLIEYLIKTYTLKGELILDNTAGSGTLAIAAINTDRNYICIEKDEHYFEVMRDRIENHNPNAIKPESRKETVSDDYVQLSLFGD